MALSLARSKTNHQTSDFGPHPVYSNAEREDWRAKMAAQRKVDVETFGGMGEQRKICGCVVCFFEICRCSLQRKVGVETFNVG